MKKIIVTFALVVLLGTAAIFTTAHAFGDRTGLAKIFQEKIDLAQDEKPGLIKQFKQRTFLRAVLNRVADRLNLTEEQKAQIRQIIQDEMPTVTPIILSGIAIHNQIKMLGTNGVYNEAEVNRLAALQAQNARLLIIAKERIKAKIFAVLTVEQRAEALEMRDAFDSQVSQHLLRELEN